MKLLLFSDLHCHNYPVGCTLPNGRNSRLQDCLDILNDVSNRAAENQCNAIVFLGDLFHARDTIDNDVMYWTIEGMQELANEFPVCLLRGNHDCFDDAGIVDSLNGLRGRKNITVISDTYITGERPGGRELWFVPWMAKPKDTFKALDPKPDTILFMHQSVSEGWVGDRHVHGSLDLDEVGCDRFTRVFAGDYHKPQELKDGRFIYLGSPLQLNFGEAGQEKRYIVYDTDTDEITQLETLAPKFYEYDNPQELKDAVSREHYDYFKVHYKSSDAEQVKLVEELSKRFTHIEFVLDPVEVLEDRCDPEVTSSDTKLMDEYVEQRADPAEHEQLIAGGLELLNGDC